MLSNLNKYFSYCLIICLNLLIYEFSAIILVVYYLKFNEMCFYAYNINILE